MFVLDFRENVNGLHDDRRTTTGMHVLVAILCSQGRESLKSHFEMRALCLCSLNIGGGSTRIVELIWVDWCVWV